MLSNLFVQVVCIDIMSKTMINNLYPLSREPRERLKDFWVNMLKLVAVLAVTILFTELLLRAGIGTQSLLMVYMLSVLVISSITPTYIHGIMAALFCTFTFDFLVTEPRMNFSFTIGAPITLFTMLVATFITSTLIIQMKSQAQLAMEREQRAQLLYEINQKLLAARDTAAIVSLSSDYLISHLKRSVIFYTRDLQPSEDGAYVQAYQNADCSVFHTPKEKKNVHRIFQKTAFESPLSTDDEPGPDVYYVSVSAKGNVLGVIGIDCRGQPISQTSLTFVQMLAGQTALALELQYLADERSHILVDAEKEKMRGTLLRAISHDLRTPLTSILGASATILDQQDMPPETRSSLAAGIKEDAQWLIRVVENLLTVTRISQENAAVTKSVEAAEEVIAQAVAIVRKRFPDHFIHVHVPDELMLVPMDATLISQVLINLLENAVKNSPPGSLVLVDLKKQGAFATFEINDNGNGIPEALLDNLFEIHTSAEARAVDAAKGMGIGLSICKTIVQAHGGTIEGCNRKKGGAKFIFRLPLQEGNEVG